MQKATAVHKLHDTDRESNADFQGVQDRDIDFLFTLFRGETWFELAAYKKY